MSEVNHLQVVAPRTIGAASSKGLAEPSSNAQPAPLQSGNKLPLVAERAPLSSSTTVDTNPAELESALSSMNDYVQSVQRDLRFAVDEELNRTVISVVDATSGELIRQIPDEIFLELARKLKDDGEFQLVSALG